MMNLYKLSFPFCLVFCIVLGSYTFLQAQHTKLSDSLALVKLFHATDGKHWKRSDNWLQGPLATWFGVTLQASGRILELHLPNNQLKGELPDEIVTLDSVRSIVLANNELYGNIPLLNNIPFYRDYASGKWFDTYYHLRYQDHPLKGNFYQFSDVEKDSILYANSHFFSLWPSNAYDNVLESKKLGIPLVLRLAQGQSHTISFPYKASKDSLDFEWYHTQRGVAPQWVATTAQPAFSIPSFDSSLHTGVWYCILRRKKELNLPNKLPSSQQSHPTILIGKVNKHPSIVLQKALSQNGPLETNDLVVKALGQPFGSLLLKGEDDAFADSLHYQVLHAPTHLQMHIYDKPWGGKAMAGTGFSGASEYTIQLHRKEEKWVGKDSLIIAAWDKEGAFASDTFYFESVADKSVLELPVMDSQYIKYKTTATGTWLYWRANPSLEKLTILVTKTTYADSNCTGRQITRWTVPLVNLALDSMFVPEVKKEAAKDVLFNVRFSPENRVGLGVPKSLTIRLSDRPLGNIPLTNFEFKVYESAKQMTVHAKTFFLDCGEGYELVLCNHQKEILTLPLFATSGNLQTVALLTGVSYQCLVYTVGRRFVTDTFHVQLQRASGDIPQLVGSMDWNVSCKKRIKKSGWVHPYVAPLKWVVGPSIHFEVHEKGDFLEVVPKNPTWNGTEKVNVRVTDSSGYVLDTFALVHQVPSDSPLKFATDTVRLTVKNEWTSINLLSQMEDIETPDSLVRLTILRKGGITLKDSLFNTQLLPSRKRSGIDTLVIKAEDEGCHAANRTFVIAFSGSTIYAPPRFKDPFAFNREFNKLIPANGFWFAEDTAAYPEKMDLNTLVKYDGPLEDLHFFIKEVDVYGNPLTAGHTLDKGLQVDTRGGIFRLKPIANQFYGYPYKEGEREYTSSIWFKMYVEDRYGDYDSSLTAYFNIANTPLFTNLPQVTYPSCGMDTLHIAVRKELQKLMPNAVIPPFKIYPDNIVSTMGCRVEGTTIKLVQQSHLFEPQENPLKLFLIWDVPFYNTLHNAQNNSLALTNLVVRAYPGCAAAPNFGQIAGQRLVGKETSTISLWSTLRGIDGSDAFWFFDGGEDLNYQYNYATGYLEVSAKQLSWKGIDTLYVKVMDGDGRTATMGILYSAAAKPVIYPIPEDMRVKTGETIPAVSLSDRVVDDVTDAVAMQWEVKTGPHLQAILQSGTLNLVPNDVHWVGSEQVTIIATDEEGLRDTAIFYVHTEQASAIEEELMDCKSKCYPNPARDLVTLVPCGQGVVTVSLTNSFGQVEWVKEVSHDALLQFDIKKLGLGMYLLRVERQQGQKEIFKIVVH